MGGDDDFGTRIWIEYRGDAIAVPLGESVIGRDVSCDLRFNDPSISRRHLRLVRRIDELFVEDLNSANGSQLNGKVVWGSARVEDGDVVTLGEREFRVRIVDSGDGVPAPSTLVGDVDLDNLPTEQSEVPIPDPIAVADQRAVTGRFEAVKLREEVAPGATQRCPECGLTVDPLDDECGGCGFGWGNFRPNAPTQVAARPTLRRHTRQPVEVPVIYASDTLEVEVVTHDLSRSGVFIGSAFLDQQGTACQLTFLIDGAAPLVVAGRVTRVVGAGGPSGIRVGMGVEFVALPEPLLAWLERVVPDA